MKTYTREELTALNKEQFDNLSKEEQQDAVKQGKAFLLAEITE